MAATDTVYRDAPGRGRGRAPHGRHQRRGTRRADGRPQGALLDLDKAPPRRGEIRLAGRAPVAGRRPAASGCSTTSRSSCAPARSWASPASPGNGQSELLQVLSGIRPPTRRPADGLRPQARCRPSRGTPRRCASWAWRTCRRTGCARAGRGVPRPRRPRSWATRTRPPSRATTCSTGRRSAPHCAELMERFDVRPRIAEPAVVEFLRRQPAEAGAGARDRARTQGAAGRSADARRRHRRHRIHSSRAGRQAATRAARCWSCRSNSTRSCRWPTASW